MSDKAVVAFVFPLPDEDDIMGLQAIIGKARTLFEDREDVKAYAVIRQPAEVIAHILTRKERSQTTNSELEVAVSESVKFSDAEDVESLIFMLAGAASTCWENLDRAGVFDSTQAKEFCEDALLRLNELSKPVDLKGDSIDIGPLCFTNGDVISYKGQNFYRACGEHVSYIEGEGQGETTCVKRVGHPGAIHEDYDGFTREDVNEV